MQYTTISFLPFIGTDSVLKLYFNHIETLLRLFEFVNFKRFYKSNLEKMENIGSFVEKMHRQTWRTECTGSQFDMTDKTITLMMKMEKKDNQIKDKEHKNK